MAASRLCSIPGCGKPRKYQEWCGAHYMRYRRHGDPLGGGRQLSPRGEPQRYFRDVVLSYEGDDCLTWPYTRSGGYAFMQVDGRPQLVSRLACEAEHGPPPSPEHEAAHLCGKGHEGCVAKRHLAWKTPKENSADRDMHGTTARGETQGRAKLTEADIREIRTLKGQMLLREIADHYGVSASMVSQIHRRVVWAWLD